ncbi:MAG: RNA polymerase sigma factor SigZ [Aureliella sp.]
MDITSTLAENETWLRSVVYSRLGDRAATEDVLQEIALALVSQAFRRDHSQVGKGWLYQVAIRQVMLFRRKEVRYRKRIEKYQSQAVAGQPSGGLEELCEQEQREAVRRGLAAMRPIDRQVLLLKYRQSLSCRQIAEHLGVSETTVQSRLLRARRRLRTWFDHRHGE